MIKEDMSSFITATAQQAVMPLLLALWLIGLVFLAQYTIQKRRILALHMVAGMVTMLFMLIFMADYSAVEPIKNWQIGGYPPLLYLLILTFLLAGMVGLSMENKERSFRQAITHLSHKFPKISSLGIGAAAALSLIVFPVPSVMQLMQQSMGGQLTFTIPHPKILLVVSMPFLIMCFYPKIANIMNHKIILRRRFLVVAALLMFVSFMWLLMQLSTLIGIQSAIVAGLVSVIAKFILDRWDYRLWQQFSRKIIISVMLLVSMIGLPIYSHYLDKQHQLKVENIWQPLEPEKIAEYIAEDKIVFVNISADWCPTCKINKFFVLDREQTLTLLAEDYIIAMHGDITKPDPVVSRYMQKLGKNAIPIYKVYGANAKEGVELPPMLTASIVAKAIRDVDPLMTISE